MAGSIDRRAKMISHGSLGQLYAAEGASVNVSISRSEDDVFLLILDGPPGFTRGSLADLTLESSGGRGVLRTPGYAQHVGPNLLRFIVDRTADLVQRREFVRVRAAQHVMIENEDATVLMDTLTIDLSGGGMLVKVPVDTALPAADIYFRVSLGPERDLDHAVSGMGRVVRTQDPGRAAVDFCAISHADQERLIRFIFDRQRLELGTGRGGGG